MKIDHTYIEPERLAVKHLENLQKAGLRFEGKRILDLGCGTGTYTRLMAEQKAALVVGIDSVNENVKFARQFNSASNVRFVCGNIEDWGIKGKFDLIFMRGSIYYLRADLDEITTNLVNMLSREGELFISFTNSNIKTNLINTLKRIASYMPKVLHPAVRTVLAGFYYLLVRYFSSGNKEEQNWNVIKNKMNTIFFPLNHLTDPKTVTQIFTEHKMSIIKIFYGQGQNPEVTADYGVWAGNKKKIYVRK